MIAANYTEFRTNLKSFLDKVEFDNEVLIIKRGSGNGTVLMSLTEYNSVMETLYLLGSKANAERLRKSIQQMKNGEILRKDLIED
jgi:antitoxin YefM